jgi:hypothetical protein
MIETIKCEQERKIEKIRSDREKRQKVKATYPSGPVFNRTATPSGKNVVNTPSSRDTPKHTRAQRWTNIQNRA